MMNAYNLTDIRVPCIKGHRSLALLGMGGEAYKTMYWCSSWIWAETSHMVPSNYLPSEKYSMTLICLDSQLLKVEPVRYQIYFDQKSSSSSGAVRVNVPDSRVTSVFLLENLTSS